MFCKNCGKRLGEDAKFCGGCGTPVSTPTENSTIQSEPTQETAQLEPVQETIQPEPVQETVQPEPTQETVQPEPMQETAQPISEVISQMKGEQKEPAPAAEPTAETTQSAAETVTDVPENSLPKSFSEAVGEQAAAAPKKKKRGKVGLIIGSSAVILAGAAAAVGYFCFSNQILRLIKGDAGYAKEIALKSYSDYILGGEEFDFGAVDSAVASRIETALSMENAAEAGYQNREIISFLNNTTSLDSILEMYGSSEIKITADIEFYSFLKAILAGNDSADEYLDALRSASLISCVQSGENGNKYTYTAKFKDTDIFRAEQYRSDEFSALAIPDLCDYTFYISSENGEKSVTIPREEITRIRNEMYKILDEAYSSAEFTYTDGEFTVAGTQVKGTEVKTVFSDELCSDILKKWGDFLKNDEFMRNFYVSASGGKISEYEDLFTDKAAEANMQIAVCNYIAPHTEIIGKTIVITDTENGKNLAIGIVNNKGESRIIADIPDGGQLSVISTTDEDVLIKDASETVRSEITFIEEKDGKPLVLDLLCENPEKITYCGKTLRAGSYTLSISDKDEMISSLLTSPRYGSDDITGNMMSLSDAGNSSAIIKEALKCAKISWSISGGENSLSTAFSVNIESMLSLRFNAELTPYSAGEAFEMPDISGEKCIDLAEETDEKTLNAVRLNISEKMLEMIDSNDVLRDIAEKTGLSDSLQKTIDEMKRGEKMLEHYSGYTQDSQYDANRYARDIFENFSRQFWKDGNDLSASDIERYPALSDDKLFTEPRTIKLYNGEQGVEIIDDAGLGFINFENVIKESGASDSKNMYIELTFDIDHALSNYTISYDDDFMNIPVLTGVCAVYTDDPNDLPAVLPDTYNYIDGLFEWDGEEGCKDDFVVGTYPLLSEGVSTAREEEEKFTKEKEKLDNDALNISKAVQLFMRQNAGVFETENANAFSLELRAGTWEILGCYDEYMYEDDEIKMLAEKSGLSEYLSDFSRLSSISGVRVQLLFGRDSYFESYDYYDYENENYDERQESESEMKLIGVAVINAAENVIFSDYYVPSYYDYVYGYSSFNNYYTSASPTAGKLYIDDSYSIPFGSWCSSTGTALSAGYEY